MSLSLSRKKSINQNDSFEQIAFIKIMNEDIDENTDIVSKNNENIKTNIKRNRNKIDVDINCKLGSDNNL